jgi:hypothetical protein
LKALWGLFFCAFSNLFVKKVVQDLTSGGENGLLVGVDDATGASKAVLRIYQDDGLKNRLVTQGMEDVHSRFNARRVSEEHGKLFERL